MFNIKSLCYDIYVVKSYLGSIAQPGERSPHTREVTGSSPVAPTLKVPRNRHFLLQKIRIFVLYTCFFNVRTGVRTKSWTVMPEKR